MGQGSVRPSTEPACMRGTPSCPHANYKINSQKMTLEAEVCHSSSSTPGRLAGVTPSSATCLAFHKPAGHDWRPHRLGLEAQDPSLHTQDVAIVWHPGLFFKTSYFKKIACVTPSSWSASSLFLRLANQPSQTVLF